MKAILTMKEILFVESASGLGSGDEFGERFRFAY